MSALNLEGRHMIDRYSKLVLTVIAGSLAIIAFNGLSPSATAQLGSACGSISYPCYVATETLKSLNVRVTN